jgi:hypothetical protein
VAGVLVVAAAPIAATEIVCRAEPAPERSPSAPMIREPEWQRAEIRSYLSYPEWAIVHAYEDFAGVLRKGDEDDFDYLASVGGFWRGMCNLNRVASAMGGSSVDMKVMLHTIGLSFTAEMALKGVWEESIGRASVLVRGPERTSEDRLSLAVAEDYAAFLRQTPWYEYPFAEKVEALWSTERREGESIIRSTERRLALTLEWGGKAGYAAFIRRASAAALGTADLRIRSVVRPGPGGLPQGVDVVADLPGGLSLIETPRYRAFTEILQGIANSGGEVIEIAGNDDLLVTVLVPPGGSPDFPGVVAVLSVPIQSRPGWHRTGLGVRVRDLAELIRSAPSAQVEFEHVYDY